MRKGIFRPFDSPFQDSGGKIIYKGERILKKVIHTGFMLLFFVQFYAASAQDVSFSQFYSNPLYLNPAFAGTAEIPRAVLQYRNQYHSFSNAFSTYSAALDLPLKKIRSGLGIFLLNDAQAGSSYQSLQVNGAYSVYVQLSEDIRMHGALQAGFNRRSLRLDQLVFPDNVDPNFGNHGISRELEYISDAAFSFMDFSTGILLFSERFFGGLAAHHLAEPRHTFYSNADSGKLPRKYTAHFGARLPVFLYGHHRKKFDISPRLVMQYQGDFGQMNYGLFATKWGVSTGAWFRQNFGLRYDALILLAGFYRKNWQLTYTYDLAVSGLWGDSGGTSEISLVFLLEKREGKRHLPFYHFYEDEFGTQ